MLCGVDGYSTSRHPGHADGGGFFEQVDMSFDSLVNVVRSMDFIDGPLIYPVLCVHELLSPPRLQPSLCMRTADDRKIILVYARRLFDNSEM